MGELCASSQSLRDYTHIYDGAELFAESLDIDATSTKPNQLLGFNFPKHQFGKMKVVSRASSLSGSDKPGFTSTPYRTSRFATLV